VPLNLLTHGRLETTHQTAFGPRADPLHQSHNRLFINQL
jgi:hypothetical protein